MSTTFSCTGNIIIKGKQQFQQANGDINNYYLLDEGSSSVGRRENERLMPTQDRFREIYRGDIILREQVHSGELEMMVRRSIKSTNPFRIRAADRIVKIRKKIFRAELVDFGDRKFTLVVLEPENKEDTNVVALVRGVSTLLFIPSAITRRFRYGNEYMSKHLLIRAPWFQ
ncbi:hypothetical protein AAF712_015951 [Marasmius tenuissimus]|uniref:Uncharacterized protein n=1 Tax=Marasmius tenuissimus TaxID=585030 RepID=A0ABR2Z851_9AGAR